ncbi:MAG: asparagine synthase (glutamine-hydrolyzing) [Sphingobacteriales bacterium]|nr:MAG: asparagine synthase (glutamine-hydrolyzing) [Sphingobacteriales bacterium]
MCRIAGIVSATADKNYLNYHIKNMANALAHGGPDGAGFFVDEGLGLALGHRRLALLDLSTAGQQPMFTTDNQIAIVFNGEIYNYLELKNELKQAGYLFNTQTDTEVIMLAYRHWGTAAFKKFNGMFAFALFDKQKNLLFLVRDVVGIKPLYYSATSDGLIFASEVKAFYQSGVKFDDNHDWKIYFLSFGFIPEPYTTLKNVYQLKPGYYLTYNFNTKSYTETQFETLVFSNTITTKTEAIASIRHQLSLAVNRHLIADAPIGVFLSGGIDSSIIALIAAKNKKQHLKTLSVTFNESYYNEEKYQKTVHNIIGGTHKNYKVSQQNYLDAIPAIQQAFDQPSGDAINTWFITRCAKEEGLKAVLSGLGGDELFGGYPTFKRVKHLNQLHKLPIRLFKIADHLSDERLRKLVYLQGNHINNDYLSLRGFYTPRVISKLIDATENEINECISSINYEIDKKTLASGNYASWLEQNIYMRSQLLKDTDYMSMAHGIEVRVPFLDKDFLKLCYSIAPEIKFAGPMGKQILIDTFNDILPQSVWKRKKMGFTFPFQEWNKKHPEINQISQHPNKAVATLGQQFLKNKLHWSRCFSLLQIQKYLPIKNVLFLTLKTFTQTGGIEKVNRILMKVGADLSSQHLIRFSGIDAYDDLPLSKYISTNRFIGLKGSLLKFIWLASKKGIKSDVVLLSHINSALVGVIIKIISPNTKLYVQAHGIEVWRELSFIKKLVLKKADFVLPVSAYTKQILTTKHKVDAAKCIVLNNCIDPNFKRNFNQNTKLKIETQTGFNHTHHILLTLTRLASSEKYKGYDHVIKAVSIIKKTNPLIRYIIAGKYDELEFIRIQALISLYDVANEVKLTGFIPDDELSTYFGIADVFVMPSKKEGFGIVFIEAMACGLAVIGGNQDGSVDALRNGEMGTLINPDDIHALVKAINHQLFTKKTFNHLQMMKKADEYFGYTQYKTQLKNILLPQYA